MNKIILFGLLVVAVVLVSGCAQQAATLTITSPTEGQEVVGPDVTIKFSTSLKVVLFFIEARGLLFPDPL